ncbi:MAG: hypothetical protein WD851_20020 [Pirellulales bacterium]
MTRRRWDWHAPIAALLLLGLPATSFAIEYLGVEFSYNLYAGVYDGNPPDSFTTDQKAGSTSFVAIDRRRYDVVGEVRRTGFMGLEGYARSESRFAYQLNSLASGVGSIDQILKLNGYLIENPLVVGDAYGAVGDGSGDIINIHFRIDESDGDVVFQSRSNYLNFIPPGAGTFNTGYGTVSIWRNNQFSGGDGTHLTPGIWTLVLQKFGIGASNVFGGLNALGQFSASWTFDGVFPGRVPQRPIAGPPAPDREQDASDQPEQVTGTFLTFPVQGDLGHSESVFVAVPTQANNGPSQGALVTSYELSSEYSPLTSFTVPELPAGAGGLTLDFGTGPQSIVAGEVVDFGAEGVGSFILDGFDPNFASAAPDAFVMGLKFAAEGLASLTAIPTLYIPPGDYNENGLVDAADYTVWRDTEPHLPEGYDLWRSKFGPPGGAGGAGQAVPEPGGMVLLVVAAFVIVATGHCSRVRRRGNGVDIPSRASGQIP